MFKVRPLAFRIIVFVGTIVAQLLHIAAMYSPGLRDVLHLCSSRDRSLRVHSVSLHAALSAPVRAPQTFRAVEWRLCFASKELHASKPRARLPFVEVFRDVEALALCPVTKPKPGLEPGSAAGGVREPYFAVRTERRVRHPSCWRSSPVRARA